MLSWRFSYIVIQVSGEIFEAEVIPLALEMTPLFKDSKVQNHMSGI